MVHETCRPNHIKNITEEKKQAHHHLILDSVLSTELARFCTVIVFTSSHHFARARTSSFTSPLLLISFSTCFFTLLSVFLYYAHFKFQSFRYQLFVFFPQNLTVPHHTTCFSHPIQRLYPTCPSTPRCFFDLIASHHTSLESSLFLFFSTTQTHAKQKMIIQNYLVNLIIALPCFPHFSIIFFNPRFKVDLRWCV